MPFCTRPPPASASSPVSTLSSHLSEARALGLKVVVWTVNEVDEMLALARMGVDGIITDHPDRAIEALAPWRSRQRRGPSHANRGW